MASEPDAVNVSGKGILFQNKKLTGSGTLQAR